MQLKLCSEEGGFQTFKPQHLKSLGSLLDTEDILCGCEQRLSGINYNYRI